MRTVIIFENYELNENGGVKNVKTQRDIKISINEKTNEKYAYLSVDGKSKKVNISKLMEENFPPIIDEVKIEKPKKSKSRRKYEIKVTQLDGKVLIFETFKAANDYYGLRKDYLNYCLTEPYYYMLTKNGLQLKSVEKILKQN